MAKSYWLALLFLSSSVFASDWHVTYFNVRSGSLLIDKDSIVETQGGMRKVWTLYAPRVTMGQPGEGYAYNKMLHQISCKDRTAAITQAVYYDVNNVPHDSVVEDKALRDIVPDSGDDYLWRYICKPDQQADLAASVGKGGISQFLQDQVKFTRENDLLLKRTNGR